MPRFDQGLRVGVTGTNGKTTTAYLIEAGLRAAGHRTYLASTVEHRFDGVAMTPPSSFGKTVELLDTLANDGATAFVLECTSFALSKGFADRVQFNTAVFTNLTHEHIEQHESWEHYLASKAQLFVRGLGDTGVAVLNAADEHAELLDDVIAPGVQRKWYTGVGRGVALRSTDLSATTTELSTDGTHIALAPSATAEALGNALHVRLVGDVFAENAIAAALALLSVGIDADTVRQSLSSMQVVPGRFEVVHNSPLVAVDFAHTPDALARTCATARRLANGGRVIVVFGAGGARDKSKREPMGKVVGAGADVAVVTSDNPRNEDPAAIANALGAAARAAGSARVLTVLDRRRAIEVALEEARPPDVVVICGKGHEQGQLVDGTTLPFSDAEVVLETLGVMPDPTPCRTEPYPCL